MEIYVEYALLENFLYDAGLLGLAYCATKSETKLWKLCLSAGFGSVFAVLYPLFSLSVWLGGICKVAVGFLLCLFPFEGLRVRGGGGRYLLTAVLFFAFSFGFGGTLLGIYGPLSMGEKIPSGAVFIAFALLSGCGIWLIKRLHTKRRLYACSYTCKVEIDGQCTTVQGFYDSGNLATHEGKPVCFVSPALLYELMGERILKGWGQVCDEMTVSTVVGEKTVPLYSGKIEVENKAFEVYFTPSKNMIGREYAVLIHARILEGQADNNAID